MLSTTGVLAKYSLNIECKIILHGYLAIRYSSIPSCHGARPLVFYEQDRPESKEYYQATSPQESALFKLVLQKEKIAYIPISFTAHGKFVERYYVKSRDGHHTQNECMLLDLEIRDGRNKKLAEEYEKIVDELQRYYDQKF